MLKELSYYKKQFRHCMYITILVTMALVTARQVPQCYETFSRSMDVDGGNKKQHAMREGDIPLMNKTP
jgi:hypothetical protein